MFRPGLLATLSALILTGCVSPSAYRAGDGGDYYYSEPRIEYYDAYGRPLGPIGYGYPFGYGHWYFRFGTYFPYGRYGYPYGYYGGPPYYHPVPPYYGPHPPHHRPPYRPPPGHTPPPERPPGGGRPHIGDRDHDREGGPWRRLEEIARQRAAPTQPATPVEPPGGAPGRAQERPRRAPVAMSQPGVSEPPGGAGRMQRTPPPAPVAPPPRPRAESPRPAMPIGERAGGRERESRRDPTP